MEEHLEWMFIDEVQFADVNPKKHDVGAMFESIMRYGLVEKPVLNEKTQKLVAGHNRIQTLQSMFAHNPSNVPNGVRVVDGRWQTQIHRGVSFRDDNEAMAYLIDSNNIGLMGAEFTALDMAKLWDENVYTEILTALNEDNTLPVSSDSEDVDLLSRIINAVEEDKGVAEDNSTDGDVPVYRITVECESDEQKESLLNQLRNEGYVCR